MLTPQAVTPTMPEITPKKREKLIPRSTARSNTPEPKHETATNPALGAPGGVARQGKPLLRLPAGPFFIVTSVFAMRRNTSQPNAFTLHRRFRLLPARTRISRPYAHAQPSGI
jgi:hypothetical protein